MGVALLISLKYWFFFLATVAVYLGSEFSLLLFLSIRYAPPFTWLDTSHTRPLSSSPHCRSSPSSLSELSLPPSSPASARRLPPLPPASSSLSLSLPRAPPLSAHLSSSCLLGGLAPPPSYSLSPAFLRQLLLRLTFRLLMASPPTHTLFRFYLFGVGFFFFSYGPGVGVCVPPPSRVTTSPVNSTAMRVLLPLPPPLGLPLTRLPPLSLRLWVIQRILCFLPLLPVSRVLYLSLLTPRLLRWPWCLRTPPTVVISSTFVHCYLYRLSASFCTTSACILSLLLGSCSSNVSLTFLYIDTVVGAPLFYGWVVAWFLPIIQDPVPVVLPQRPASWALQCYYALGRQCQFLWPSFPISCVLFVCLTYGRLRPRCLGSWGVLPCPVRGSCWPCVVLMCCVRLTAGFYSRWSCFLPPPCHVSSMCLAHQAQVSASHTAFLVFITANSTRLLFVVSQRPIISSPAVLVDSLFLVWVVNISSRRLGLRFPSGRSST